MNVRKKNSIACLAVLLTMSISCRSPESYSSDSTPGQIVPEQFADLAVPQHLKLQTGLNQSYTFKRGEFRTGHLEYRGKGKIANNQKYLREQLHQRGWSLKLEDIPTGTKIVQKWTSHPREGLYYTLLATLVAKGDELFLTFDLDTKTNTQDGATRTPTRTGANPVEADLKSSK